nr:hypothetical protein CFP56_24498 [Quercus suber]
MFPTRPRPVPSKAALKVLYQLAYITSGTAVGVATLCVEERRRRLQLVQKVADNAKRLRQSPRYYQNVALAENHPEVERRLHLEEYEDIKGPELASVVEKEYGRNNLRNREHSHKRKVKIRESRDGTHIVENSLSHHPAIDAAQSSSRSSPRLRSQRRPQRTAIRRGASEVDTAELEISRSRSRISKQQNGPKIRNAQIKDSHWPFRHSNNVLTQSSRVSTQDWDLNTFETSRPTSKRQTIADVHGEHIDVKQMVKVRFEGKRCVSTPPTSSTLTAHEVLDKLLEEGRRFLALEKQLGCTPSQPVSAADATHDVDLLLEYAQFQAKDKKKSITVASDQVWIDTAIDLLFVVLELGSWMDVVRLSRWMDDRMILNTIHIRSIMNALALQETHARLTSGVLIDTCHSIFALKSFRSKAPKYRFERGLELSLCHFVDSGSKKTQYRDRFHQTRLSENQAFFASMLTSSDVQGEVAHLALSPSDKQVLSDTILSLTRTLLEQNRYADAFDMISACGYSINFGNTPESLAALVDRKFHKALTSDELDDCAILLRIENWNTATENFASYRDSLVRICNQTRAFRLLEELFLDPETMIEPRFETLDGDDDRLAVLTLAAAVSPPTIPPTKQTTKDSFTTYYTRLSQRLRSRVAKSYPLADVMGLWATTRNYSRTISRLQVLKDDLGDSDPGAARAVLLAQLDVQIRNDDFELARESLAVLHKSKPADNDTVGRAALMLAKTNDWKHFDELLKLAKKSSFLQLEPKCITKLNAAISVFSRCHTAHETWSFVTKLIHDYDFTPNQATTEILLGAFTSGRSYDLIPHWLRYLRTMGIHFNFDAKVVVKLLTRYYRENRPSHVLVISFCRNLCKFAPCLDGADYMSLVEEAVGFDIRNFAGLRHSTENTVEARARLQSLSFMPQGDTSTKLPRANEHQFPTRPQPDQHNDNDKIQEEVSHEIADPTAFCERSHSTVIRSCSQPIAGTKACLAREPSQQESGQMLDDCTANFSSLRHSYQTSSEDLPNVFDIDVGHIQSEHSEPVRQMILALSLKQNNKVLSIYSKSLGTNELPISPLALEIAVEASLRIHHGNTAPAEAIMTKAHEAGMNTACGMGPMLIQKIRNFGREGKQNGRRLRVTVLQYYRMNQERGLPIKHEVATTAAFALLRSDRPREAVRILEGVHRSDWAQEQPLDLAAMTVFLRAYAALGEKKGIKWVIDTVLARNMRIDLKFLKALRDVSKLVSKSAHTDRHIPQASRIDDTAFLSNAIELLKTRRAQQLLETKKLGSRLTAVLAHCANQTSSKSIDVDAWPELEKAIFGAALKPIGVPSDATRQERTASIKPNEPAGSHGVESSAGPEGRDLQLKHASNSDQPRLLDNDRLYSEFLKRDIVMADGKTLSFRKSLVTSTSNFGWTAKPFLPRRKRLRKDGAGQTAKASTKRSLQRKPASSRVTE